MKRMFLFTLVLVVWALLVVACSGTKSEEAADQETPEEVQLDAGEEDLISRVYVDPPDEFADLTNPFSGDADALAQGKVIFEDKCEECHGSEGAGDGPKTANLNPKPADLGDSAVMASRSDGYLFWRVSRGGMREPFNSSMKAFDMSLTEEQRWQVISHVRTFSE